MLSDHDVDPHEELIESVTGSRVGGRYIVDRVLGRGGMGFVAAGRYPELDQQVAVKFMWPELAANPVLSTRFLREARVAANVHSPHLVKVFDVGKLDDGIPYLVMERLTGRDLADELDQRGPLSIADTVDYMLQAMEGIAEVHAAGMVHRDLKPSNLFLARGPGGATIKVLDFGITKEITAQSASITATDAILGTPSYMSPEQVKASKEVDARSDIWAIGVIAYELLTKHHPFSGESVGELFGAILHLEPTDPAEHRKDLPLDLVAVLMKCLKRKREDRYESLAELAEALAPFASPDSGHRVSAIGRTLTIAKRNAAVTVAKSPKKAELEPTSEIPTRRPGDGPTPPDPISSPAPSSQQPFDVHTAARPAPPLSPFIRPRVEIPAGSVTSASWGSDTGSGRRSRTLIGALVVVFLLGIGVSVFLMQRHGDDAKNIPTADTAVQTASVAPAGTPAQPVTVETPVVSPTPAATSAEAPVASAPKTADTSQPKTKRTAQPVASGKPPTTATAAPTASPLILDRK